MQPARQPVLVGVGQLTNRTRDPREVKEPLAMMAEVAEIAARDAEAPRLLHELDSVTVINVISRSYPDPARQLAERIGACPSERLYTTMGGNSPQWRVNETADRIGRGEVRLALIAGAEAMHGLRLARRAGVQLDWSTAGTAASMVGDGRWGSSPLEQRHHAQLPAHVYPLFENALRARRRWSIPAHRQHLAAFCACFAAVARDNPYAWFRGGKSAAEIGTVTDHNRMIAFPYPKFMNAIMNVDQAAALILTDVETARRLSIPESKWVYVWGCGDATDHWFLSDRVDYTTSPAIRLAGERALCQAGLSIERIGHFDLYSCFPSAAQIAAEMLALSADDPRPLTVTGGLPYHGGPGNNYSTHAIACLAERLRAQPGATGLISSVGWYLTKHAVGVYSSAPSPRPWRREDPRRYQRIVDDEPHPEMVEVGSGVGTVETYTVVHDRDGRPSLGIVVARLADARRCWANITDAEVLERMEQVEFVGQQGRLRHHDPTQVNIFEP
jgi:acetyl-CoA C-acetyltransferase